MLMLKHLNRWDWFAFVSIAMVFVGVVLEVWSDRRQFKSDLSLSLREFAKKNWEASGKLIKQIGLQGVAVRIVRQKENKEAGDFANDILDGVFESGINLVSKQVTLNGQPLIAVDAEVLPENSINEGMFALEGVRVALPRGHDG